MNQKYPQQFNLTEQAQSGKTMSIRIDQNQIIKQFIPFTEQQEPSTAQYDNNKKTKPQSQQNKQSITSIIKNISIKKKIIFSILFLTSLYIFRNLIIIAFIDGGMYVSWIPWKQNSWFDLIKLQSTSAICLDGSNAAYYLSEDGDPSKIFLHFQEGGWCGSVTKDLTLQSCYARGSAYKKIFPQRTSKKIINHDIMSMKSDNYFKDWKKVYIIYCDGSGHQGTKKQPINHNGMDLYFRGHNITVETLQDLEKKIGIFSKASKVVVGGASAGGLAVFLWTNYIVERVMNGKVWALPDSGIFLDIQDAETHTHQYRQQFTNLMDITNVQIDPPASECIKDFPNSRQNCMFAQHLYKYIKAPIFAIQSLYDLWSIEMILNVRCPPSRQLDECSQLQKKEILQYRRKVSALLVQIGKNQTNGYWAPLTPFHILTEYPQYFLSQKWLYQQSDKTLNQVIGEWIQNKPTNRRFIDNKQQEQTN